MMNRIAKSIAALTFSVLMTNLSLAQKASKQDFKNVDLKELRKMVVGELLSDGLISKQRDDVYLAIQLENTILNDQQLDNELHQKYSDLLVAFDIDRGSDRVIYITRECVAVGDFRDGSFNGRIHGRLDLDEHPFSTREYDKKTR